MSNDNKKPSKVEKDKVTGVETTGHEWDGIKELNNPSPRWWLWVFLICCIWSVGYWVVYPAWPTVDGHTKGSYGWTQYGQLKEQQGVIFERKAKYLKALKAKELNEISTDPELYKFAVAGGNIVF